MIRNDQDNSEENERMLLEDFFKVLPKNFSDCGIGFSENCWKHTNSCLFWPWKFYISWTWIFV